MLPRLARLVEFLRVKIAQKKMRAGLFRMLGHELLEFVCRILRIVSLLQNPGEGITGVRRAGLQLQRFVQRRESRRVVLRVDGGKAQRQRRLKIGGVGVHRLLIGRHGIVQTPLALGGGPFLDEALRRGAISRDRCDGNGISIALSPERSPASVSGADLCVPIQLRGFILSNNDFFGATTAGCGAPASSVIVCSVGADRGGTGIRFVNGFDVFGDGRFRFRHGGRPCHRRGCGRRRGPGSGDGFCGRRNERLLTGTGGGLFWGGQVGPRGDLHRRRRGRRAAGLDRRVGRRRRRRHAWGRDWPAAAPRAG